jgi:hypothetical protein
VDGSFHVEAKDGGVGTFLRDNKGVIIFTACRSLGACSSALEVELVACLEGCRIMFQWRNLLCIMESDCLEAVNLVN